MQFIGVDMARLGSDRTVIFCGVGRNFGKTASLDPALTARPVQGSHRFMDTKREIPAADPDAGYKIRIDRALDELVAALTATPAPKLTADQHERIRKLAALSGAV